MISKSDKNKIVKLYLKGGTSTKIAKKFSIHHSSVLNILKEKNIERRKSYRKYKFKDENYFSKIDSEEKAYFLGLLYADGCNYAKNSSIILTLQECDKYILEKYNNILYKNRPLLFKPKRKLNHQNCYSLLIISKKICNDLIILGCVPVKSLILKFPTSQQVPEYLIHHFIRGYFDGDGCISIVKNRATFNIVSSIEFCNSLKNFLENNINIKMQICKERFKNQKFSQIRSCGNQQCLKFLNFIYKNSNIFLKRKYDKFLLLNKINNFLSIKRKTEIYPSIPKICPICNKNFIAHYYSRKNCYNCRFTKLDEKRLPNNKNNNYRILNKKQKSLSNI